MLEGKGQKKQQLSCLVSLHIKSMIFKAAVPVYKLIFCDVDVAKTPPAPSPAPSPKTTHSRLGFERKIFVTSHHTLKRVKESQ